MVALWNHKWTVLTLLTAAFSIAVVIGTVVDPYPGDTVAERVSIVSVFTAGALAALVGLWLFRRGQRPILASLAVGLGVVPAGMLFWLVLPTIVTVLIIAGGVLAGGLRRELSAPQNQTHVALA